MKKGTAIAVPINIDMEETIVNKNNDHGFLLSFLINLAFRFGWLLFIIVFLVLYFIVGWPLWLMLIPVGLWIIHSLIITILMYVGNKAGNNSNTEVQKENIDPYSKTNNDFPGVKNDK